MSTLSEGPASLRATAAGDGEPDPFGRTRLEHELAGPPRREPGLLPCGAQIGRYVVMAQLGRGGMGIVYAAYDPELDRKVALKLLVGETAALAEDRLQREARAMAQLAHPNVVTVHDVGTLDGRLWIAMEFVDGMTLTDWIRARRRGWREVLAMFLAAGEGLVAAHRAGIVHRDFKPDNVMVGKDGRARVMDFGLARETASAPIEVTGTTEETLDPLRSSALVGPLTRVGSVLGTPRYMAPEQWEGGPVDARTDGFAFCMALWEALYGQPPMTGPTLAAQALAVTTGQFMPLPSGVRVPGWVRKACKRGLAVDPTERWGSMAELLAALRRDPAPRRKALAAAIFVVVIAGVGWAATAVKAARREAACVAASAGLEPTWNAATRAEVHAAMLASGAPHADTTFERTMPWLDQFATRWSDTAGATCRAAMVERTVPPVRAWQIMACLDEGRSEFGQMIDELRRGDPAMLRSAVSVSSDLSDPRACSEAERLADHEPGAWSERAEISGLRNDLRRAGVLRQARQFAPAAAMVAAIETRAAALDAPIMLAMARQEAGIIAHHRGDLQDARKRLEAAYYTAGAAAADELAVDSAKWLAYLIGYELAQTELGLVWGRIAEMTLDRMHVGAVDLRRATLDSDLGVVLLQHGDLDAALIRMQRSIAVYEQLLGPDHPEIGPALNNLGSIRYARSEYGEGLAIFERVVALEVKNVGPEHSNVALARGNAAALHLALGDLEAARAGFTSAAEILGRIRGPEHPDVAAAHVNLANLEASAGASAVALGHVQRAAAIYEKSHGPHNDAVAGVQAQIGDLQQRLGQSSAALAAHRRAVAIYERNHGPAYPALAGSLAGIGAALLADGAIDEARAHYLRALAIAETQPAPATSRPLCGLGDVALARGDHAGARELFARAVAVGEAAHGGDHSDLTAALRGLGEAQLGLGDAATAVVTLARAVRLHETSRFSPVGAARARFALARALWATSGARTAADRTGAADRSVAIAEALAEASRARDALRSAGDGGRVLLAEVETWLAEHNDD